VPVPDPVPVPVPALCAGLVVVVAVVLPLLVAVVPGCPVVCLRVSNVMVVMAGDGDPLQPIRPAEHRKRSKVQEL